MSKNNHTYITHQLNNSPSKTAYSFARAPRRQQPHISSYNNVDNNEGARVIQKRAISPYRNNPYRQWRQIVRSNQINEAWQPNANKNKSRSNEKSINKNKSKSPIKRINSENSPSRNLNTNKSSQKIHSSNHRSHLNGQYYPIGVEINEDGKYVVSKFHNVSSPNFGPLPDKNSPTKRKAVNPLGPGSYEISNNSPGKYFQSKNKNNTGYSFSKSPRKGPGEKSYGDGPGMYDSFSQFGRY